MVKESTYSNYYNYFLTLFKRNVIYFSAPAARRAILIRRKISEKIIRFSQKIDLSPFHQAGYTMKNGKETHNLWQRKHLTTSPIIKIQMGRC